VKPTIEAFNNRPKHGEQFRSPLTGVDLIVPYVKSARGIAPRIRGLVNWEWRPASRSQRTRARPRLGACTTAQRRTRADEAETRTPLQKPANQKAIDWRTERRYVTSSGSRGPVSQADRQTE
jgi:hypothetical protein